MTLLNNRTFTIVLRQGTQTNLNLSTTYLTQGELVYTTDTNQVYVGDGTNKLLIGGGGVSATITTAKLTPGGANGSMTFVNGVLTAQTPAT